MRLCVREEEETTKYQRFPWCRLSIATSLPLYRRKFQEESFKESANENGDFSLGDRALAVSNRQIPRGIK